MCAQTKYTVRVCVTNMKLVCVAKYQYNDIEYMTSNIYIHIYLRYRVYNVEYVYIIIYDYIPG